MNRLAAQRRMWLLVKAKEKELKDERARFERNIRGDDVELFERENSISPSKHRDTS